MVCVAVDGAPMLHEHAREWSCDVKGHELWLGLRCEGLPKRLPGSFLSEYQASPAKLRRVVRGAEKSCGEA